MRKVKQDVLKSRINVRPTHSLNSTLSLVKKEVTPFQVDQDHSKKALREYEPRILLIDDDPIAQFIQKRMLLELNCQVTVASNAKQALEMMKSDYDVVLLDIGLPDIYGTELAVAIQRISRVGRHTRIIVITAHQEDELKRECLALGVEKVLYKPVDISTLKGLIFSQ
jgi:two-component system capsular synthesis sensor histidine kinase RcsC